MELNRLEAGLSAGVPYPNWDSPAARAPAPEPRMDLPEMVVSALLDELDYGVMLLRADGRVAYINRSARAELKLGGCLDIVDGRPRAHQAEDGARLAAALAGAQRGLRRLASLAGPAGSGRRELAFVPMSTAPGEAGLIAVLFGRRRLCEPISVQCFAQAHGLTPAELRVLELLCEGLEPRAIASANDVGLATVRTQVHSIRDKTGMPSIRALLQRVAMLPPMVSSLRC